MHTVTRLLPVNIWTAYRISAAQLLLSTTTALVLPVLF
jgi:hypothetical protein